MKYTFKELDEVEKLAQKLDVPRHGGDFDERSQTNEVRKKLKQIEALLLEVKLDVLKREGN